MFSRNIFGDIERLIFNPLSDNLGIRDDHKRFILQFLRTPSSKTTMNLYQFIANVHRKTYVFDLMNELRAYEDGFTEILSDHRDHYIHSASVYVLGLAIYNNCEPIRKALNIERHEDYSTHDQKTSFLFRWSVAACLHDLAYPLELSLKSFNKYSRYFHRENYSFLKINRDVYELINLLPILDPDNNAMSAVRKDTALGMIANHLTRHRLWNSPITYETLLDFIKNFLEKNLTIGRIDHGIFSSLLILKRIHELYKKKNWDIWDFYYEVIDSATAIFLHNSYRHSELKNIFGNGKFNYDYPSSLGYLLYLSDTLCEWLRDRKNDYKLYGVQVDNNSIVFRVPKKTINKIKPGAELFDDRIPIMITNKWNFQI